MAKRDKLTRQQQSRIRRKQARIHERLEQSAADQHQLSDDLLRDESLGDEQKGLVITRFGEQADVANEQGETQRCYLRQNLGSLVSGDEVVFRINQQGEGVVTSRLPRRSELKRPTPHAGIKTIVANVDRIFVVVAPKPEFSETLLDRYLVAVELEHLPATIVVNKMDLLSEQEQAELTERLSVYQQLGYPLLHVSAQKPDSLSALQQAIGAQSVIFVGQSGVGKSSLINALHPQADASTKQISESSGLGQHTTTASRLYFLPHGGHLIDSPGVREFALWHINEQQLTDGFIDVAKWSGRCKFRDCKHQGEPGCAVTAAADRGDLHPARLNSFLQLREQLVKPR